MKRTLVFVVLLVGFLGSQVASACAEGADSPPDVDRLAARMTANRDLYASIRDESLATYAKLHPTPSDYDKQAQTVIRLAAYLRVWGDFYGEGLWKIALDQSRHVIGAGFTDPLLLILQPIHTIESNKSSDDDVCVRIDDQANKFAASDYPHAFKLWFYTIDIKNLTGTLKNHQLSDTNAARLLIAVQNGAKEYGALVKAHVNPDFLATVGDAYLHATQPDESSVKLAGENMESIFAETDPASALHATMQGKYFITWAWNARGTGYANTLTRQGVSLFGDRLQKAADILKDASTKHPDAGMIAREMITVDLGQGNGRDDMELWFGRAMKANPNDYAACLAKAYYLAPQWYGTDDDLWSFGVECAQTQNWAGKIPMVLVDLTVSYLWKRHPENFTDEKKWAVYQATLRGYLDHYPNSVYYRSIYARWAAESGHFAESEEQFKILGDNWDRDVFPGGRYEEMRCKADAGLSAGAVPSPAK